MNEFMDNYLKENILIDWWKSFLFKKHLGIYRL